MSIYGLNILPNHDRARLLSTLATLKPAAVVVMDDPPLASAIRAASLGTTVIFRKYAPGDHEAHNKNSPEQWYASHRAFAADGIVLQVLNEPQGYTDLRPVANWCAQIVRLAAADGRRVCVGNFSVGNPDEKRIAAGECDELLRVLDEHPDQYLGLHEYAQRSPRDETPWRIGRFKFWLDRAAQLGIKPPNIVITEFGRDVAGGQNDGWQSVLSETQYTQFLLEAESTYAAARIPVCIYCYGRGYGWDKFNIEGAGALLATLASANARIGVGGEQTPATPPPAQTAPPEWERVRLTSSSNHVRTTTSTTSAIVRTVTQGVEFEVDTANPTKPNQYTWYPVRLEGGLTGFMASPPAAWEYLSLPPIPEPEPPPDDTPPALRTIFLTVDEFRQLLEEQRSLTAAYDLMRVGMRDICDKTDAVVDILDTMINHQQAINDLLEAALERHDKETV